MSDAIQQFRDALRRRNIIPPDNIVDGRLRRCDAEGKNGKGDAAYLLYLDRVPAGGFENHRDGLGWETWSASVDRKLSQVEVAAQQERIAVARKRRDDEEVKRHAKVATIAEKLWEAADPASVAHPYLTKKRVQPHGARLYRGELIISGMQCDGALMMHMRDIDGKTWNLQFIAPGGEKRFLHGGRKRGLYYGIAAKLDDGICVAEGFATAASIVEATGRSTLVAFDTGNLSAVAAAFREKHPDLPITVCGDDDYETTGNPGRTKALEAAHAVDGLVAFPDFGADRPEGATDFNDLAQHRDAEAVKRAVANAHAPEVSAGQQGAPSATANDLTSRDQSVLNAPGGESDNLMDAVARLAAMLPLEYEKVRDTEAAKLGVRVGVLDKEVSLARRARQEEGGKAAMFPTVEPWPDPVNATELLFELLAAVQRFIACARETAVAAALWIAFTWLVDRVQVAPLAVVTAPEKRCGKTQLLSLFGKLSRRPLVASNISPAATFRVIEAHGPTLLIDEADAFLRENEEMRSVINSGHTRQAAYVIRTVGDDHEPRQFSTWGAKAIAGIGILAETIMDRAIVLKLRRKLPSESVERLRHAEAGLFDRLASMLARFAEDVGPAIERARPHLPEKLNDRAQDNWEPLLAIADHAGGEWPQLARATALKLSGVDQEPVSLSAELLSDIRDVFEEKHVDRISTADLLQALTNDDLKPWATYNRGKPMSARQLAKRLEEYRVSSKNLKMGFADVKKGFERVQFADAFARYLSSSPDTPAEDATPLPSGENQAGTRTYRVAESEGGSATYPAAATSKPAPVLKGSAVADKPGMSDRRMVEVEV